MTKISDFYFCSFWNEFICFLSDIKRSIHLSIFRFLGNISSDYTNGTYIEGIKGIAD